jgi:predicted RNase H-like nuclease (RuvC/YqgF family)
MKKMTPSSWAQQNNDKQHQGTQGCPQNTLKEEILQEITENFMDKILNMLTKIYKMHSRIFKTSKINKEYEKTQKQINGLKLSLNKYQTETENTIER